MAGIDAWYLLQFAPIAIGITFFLLASNTNIGMEKIALDPSEACESIDSGNEAQAERVFDKRLPVLCARIADANGLRAWKGYVWHFEDMRRRVFFRKAYDSLMQNGTLDRGMSLRKVERLTYERLGIVDIAQLGRMKDGEGTAGKLVLFTADMHSAMSCILSFSRSSAIALSYLADYRLEVLGA